MTPPPTNPLPNFGICQESFFFQRAISFKIGSNPPLKKKKSGSPLLIIMLQARKNSEQNILLSQGFIALRKLLDVLWVMLTHIVHQATGKRDKSL